MLKSLMANLKNLARNLRIIPIVLFTGLLLLASPFSRAQDQNDTSKENPSIDTTVSPNLNSSKPDQNEEALKYEAPELEGSQDDSNKHHLIRRIVLFPLETNGQYPKESNLAWWKVRELFSDQSRFLVATKRFMEQKEVFQPRGNILISDVILLTKLLDSDCLITTYIENRKLNMSAYSAQDGLLLWRKNILFDNSKPISQQLEEKSLRLANDFLAHIPYQGYQIMDPLSQSPITYEGETMIAQIDVGAKSTVQPGEKAQWLEIERSSTSPLFQGGGVIKVIAEGEVLENKDQVLKIKINRLKNIDLIKKRSLVSIPDEYQRKYNLYALKDTKDIEPQISLLAEPMSPATKALPQSRPLLVSLTSIANIVLALLLAF